ncbi:MAG: hypothetical protein ACTSWN_14505, partial [Promethearchaeota archaeon]
LLEVIFDYIITVVNDNNDSLKSMNERVNELSVNIHQAFNTLMQYIQQCFQFLIDKLYEKSLSLNPPQSNSQPAQQSLVIPGRKAAEVRRETNQEITVARKETNEACNFPIPPPPRPYSRQQHLSSPPPPPPPPSLNMPPKSPKAPKPINRTPKLTLLDEIKNAIKNRKID